ncbi:hypothetical protein CORC01_13855 [Colletotrichum orchidophilum]|uniref:Uncharacterized protein n=1 Tax=Colletotrichum orchidophilum TaxID=1209926 RepID=A0A1G4AP95_9PEZI|nr:uncharacterized protein CORC01_13855 [Colletotrichum orchidophilum]OHE90852.1 hypothetical protein CORC01_13855 [Colletotrichum orchidophilum]
MAWLSRESCLGLFARLGPLIRPIISSTRHQIHQTNISVLIPEKHPLIRPNPCSGALHQRGKTGSRPSVLTPLSLLQEEPKKKKKKKRTSTSPQSYSSQECLALSNVNRGNSHLASREENGISWRSKRFGPGF